MLSQRSGDDATACNGDLQAGLSSVQPNQTTVYNISGRARVHLGDNYMSSAGAGTSSAKKRFLDRLSFVSMHARSEQIASAFPDTYKWVLQPSHRVHRSCDCIVAWVGQAQPKSKVFWIHGKPGSGKSTMMKFLDSKIDKPKYTMPWTAESTVVRVKHYFWSAGSDLQKSVEGLCRSLLLQILEQVPAAMDFAMMSCRHVDLREDSNTSNVPQLRTILLAVVREIGQTFKILFLVDGLDECGINRDEEDQLVDILNSLAKSANVKLILASRPEVVFKEIFLECPQLRLEDLTKSDIWLYVTSQLQRQRRWKFIESEDERGAKELTSKIIKHAEGVFLWVVLIIRDVVRDLRDGDDLDQLQQKVSHLPSDLNVYFMRIIESIEPSHRREASVLLQLALHKETQFVRLVPLRLIDILFVDKASNNFVLYPDFNFCCIDLEHWKGLKAKIEAAGRKLSSRCKGLLQCLGNVEFALSAPSHLPSGQDQYAMRSQELGLPVLPVENLFDLKVVLLHRSLRDFLLLPHTQAILHSYTGGLPVDARRHISNARLVQLLALCKAEYWHDITVSTASHLLAALVVDKEAVDAVGRAALVRDAVERLATRVTSSDHGYYYIDGPLNAWHEEQSNFLTLAIDFGLTRYVLDTIKPASIREKKGRPILDYVLRPRFTALTEPIYSSGDIRLIHAALACGADPNEEYDGVSVWALYICYLADYLASPSCSEGNGGYDAQVTCIHALEALIQAGAETMLPLSWLSVPAFDDVSCPRPKTRFADRWQVECPRKTDPAQESALAPDTLISVSSMLQLLRWHNTLSIAEVVQALWSKEPVRVDVI